LWLTYDHSWWGRGPQPQKRQQAALSTCLLRYADVFLLCHLAKVKAFSKTFTTEVISLPECRPPANRLEGNSICLDGRPLGGCTLLPPRDPVLLHLTFHSISPGFILLTVGSWVGEAANVVTPVNIAGVFNRPQFFKREANLRDCHCNTDQRGGWLLDRKEAFFEQKRSLSG